MVDKDAVRRWRWRRLSIARGKHRVARKGRTYNSTRFDPNFVQLNPKVHIPPIGRRTIVIELPEQMHLDSREAASDVLNKLDEIRQAALSGEYKEIRVNHQDVQVLSPGVAVLLLAEYQRCMAYAGKTTKISANHSRSHAVTKMLADIGFYDALGIKAPKLPSTLPDRTYARVERGNWVQAVSATKLIKCFETIVNFDPPDRKRLHVSLVECMDNVFQHAYSKRSGEPYLFRIWWMAGFADHYHPRIEFVFFDQGQGIPTTIKKKKKKRVLDRLRLWTDADWIQRAVTKPFSRFGSARRGHGLQKLKAFIDRLDDPGFLRVISNKGDYVIDNSGRSEKTTLDGSLDGTLVIWSLSDQDQEEDIIEGAA